MNYKRVLILFLILMAVVATLNAAVAEDETFSIVDSDLDENGTCYIHINVYSNTDENCSNRTVLVNLTDSEGNTTSYNLTTVPDVMSNEGGADIYDVKYDEMYNFSVDVVGDDKLPSEHHDGVVYTPENPNSTDDTNSSDKRVSNETAGEDNLTANSDETNKETESSGILRAAEGLDGIKI